MKDFLKKRPLSWSAIDSFERNKEQWYSRYILGEKTVENKEMILGKVFAKSCEDGKPLAPVTLYSKVEYPLKAKYNGIPLIGFIDTYEPHSKLGEFKTSKKPWDQSKVDKHGQLTMYALMLWIQHKVDPETLHIQLQNILTCEDENFDLQFVEPREVYTFTTKRSRVEVSKFGKRIDDVVAAMESYVALKNI